ncbi:hypothetical protein PybrP1_007943 [[Pythium] brassicae (nom. inval.)]|nr:hypothetical protein PybrP1_007943 [[Pythium] brassicae (nom. inval.)]
MRIRGPHRPPATSGSLPWIVRLFVAVLCCGLALQLWLWRVSAPSSSTFVDPANAWRRDGAARLRTVHGDSEQQPRTSVPLTPSPVNASALEARRARFSPAHHSADQKKVAAMVRWAWDGYAKFAYGHDSLNVREMKGTGLPARDMALTLVDSLDTLFLVGMFDDFDHASAWVQHLLEIADKLGNALSPAFQVYDHGVPDKNYDILRKQSSDTASLAEVGSLQLEFKFLARLTGNQRYFDQVERVMDSLADDVSSKFTDGLLPVNINSRSGHVVGGKVTLGANGDSYYEYLLKQWLLSGKRDEKYKARYLTAVNGIMSKLVGKSKPSGLVFIGELVRDELQPKMDHLVCFVPGMLALGYLHGMPKEHLRLAEQLIETCYQMYAQMAAKLAPEIAYFHTADDAESDLDIHEQDAFNLLRPETVESLMVLYRVTKNDKYRQYGREIMNAFEKQCRLDKGGYSSIGNVATGPVQRMYREEMESFFIAETLKYLFLLFSDDSVFPLDEIVFNTEAHPFSMAK